MHSYSNNSDRVLLFRRLEQKATLLPDPGDLPRPVHRPAWRRWTAGERALAVALYRAGASMCEIARRVGHGGDSVRGVLVRAGVAIRPRPRILTDAMLDEATSEHAQGVSWAELGRRFGVSATSVIAAVRRRVKVG